MNFIEVLPLICSSHSELQGKFHARLFEMTSHNPPALYVCHRDHGHNAEIHC